MKTLFLGANTRGVERKAGDGAERKAGAGANLPTGREAKPGRETKPELMRPCGADDPRKPPMER